MAPPKEPVPNSVPKSPAAHFPTTQNTPHEAETKPIAAPPEPSRPNDPSYPSTHTTHHTTHVTRHRSHHTTRRTRHTTHYRTQHATTTTSTSTTPPHEATTPTSATRPTHLTTRPGTHQTRGNPNTVHNRRTTVPTRHTPIFSVLVITRNNNVSHRTTVLTTDLHHGTPNFHNQLVITRPRPANT